MSYAYDQAPVIQVSQMLRAQFIRRTYAHLAGAILAFAALEYVIFQTGIADSYLRMLTNSPGTYLIMFLGFIGVSWVANMWARSDVSRALQYAGLALYVGLEAIIFVPLLKYAQDRTGDASLIGQAGIMTLAIVAGLTATTFITRKDFSFLGSVISIAMFAAIGIVICAMIFGLGLGLWFSLLMVAVASASILYETSNIMYYYRTDQYVAASLGLFASVALLFYYVLRIFASSRN